MAATASDASEDGKGHRARLRARLFEGGPDALLDHELVEYLLALAIPQRDTKPLAKRLLDEFGGIGRLLSADPRRIAKVGKISGGRGRGWLALPLLAGRGRCRACRWLPVLSADQE